MCVLFFILFPLVVLDIKPRVSFMLGNLSTVNCLSPVVLFYQVPLLPPHLKLTIRPCDHHLVDVYSCACGAFVEKEVKFCSQCGNGVITL